MKKVLLIVSSLILLIMSGQAKSECSTVKARTKPDTQYELLNNGSEVKDKKTGLIWQRCLVGMTWNGTACLGTATSYMSENVLSQAAIVANSSTVPWRVPNVKELSSLVDFSCSGYSVNSAIFPFNFSHIFTSNYSQTNSEPQLMVLYDIERAYLRENGGDAGLLLVRGSRG